MKEFIVLKFLDSDGKSDHYFHDEDVMEKSLEITYSKVGKLIYLKTGPGFSVLVEYPDGERKKVAVIKRETITDRIDHL